jgi:diphthamide synthase (EF-2-diphthine--ammonia ligase)
MFACLLAHKARGVAACAFGDIFLEDLKRWREDNLAQVGLRGIFPLWKNDSRELIREFFALGFGTVICCANDAYLGEAAVGRNLDANFIAALPPEVDPCGENGEFHSFAFGGPVFQQSVKFKVGEKSYRPVDPAASSDAANSTYVCPSGPRQTKGFWFCDLLPV